MKGNKSKTGIPQTNPNSLANLTKGKRYFKGMISPNKGKKGLYKHTKEWKEKMSLIIKSKGNIPPSPLGRKMSDETKKKISLANTGKKRTDKQKKLLSDKHKGIHFIRIKDRTKLKKSEKKHLDTNYKYWMLEVKKRDNWKCRLLNSDCKGRLESHHIFRWNNYPELRYVVNNGITLCAFHHPRGCEEEKRMIPIFQELLSVSKE